ncbi:MAG: kynureninase [Devosia nanyangense]|uniref:Kynureninase n=1 Tax=Devosia nanyangense TaxID=1228055 RepID=A0A933L0V4_9HYPH|nr:kynureninase [Devosia nanyangense]
MSHVSRSRIQELDAGDPLAHARDRFTLPEGVIYLDGNSLGAMPKAAAGRVATTVEEEWGRGLIRSWNTADWIDLPRTVGEKIARLIGAASGTVVVADSTTLNLFKVLAVALSLRPDRRVILSEEGNFPTDLYIASGLADLLGKGHELRLVPPAQVAGAITSDVAVVMLTEVNYRTGFKRDMAGLTRMTHDAGALSLWDLAHSAGAFPVDLAGADADFAVGCGYKYLNGGPGAPAFAYVAPRFLAGLRQPLTGWLGHARPFAFAPNYEPAPGIDALRVGTPSVIGMSALDEALTAFDGIALVDLRRKADMLWDVFVSEVDGAAPELTPITPSDPALRGTQASFRHPEAYAIMQALIARGVIGDYREPDILRFGITPLYLRYIDVWKAARAIGEVMATRAWDTPEFKRKAKVV